VILTSPRSSKTESGCSSYGHFGFSCFCLFPGPETPASDGRRLRPKICFFRFRPEFWPRTSGYLCQAGDSGRHIFWSGARLCIGLRVFLTLGQRLGVGDSGLQGWRLRGKCPAMTSFSGGAIKGPLVPPWAGGFLLSFLHCWTLKLCSLSPLLWFLLNLEGKERADLDLRFYQSTSPVSEGNHLDLDLGVHLLISSLFFLSYPSIAFVDLVGFWREGFDHFVCSCHCIWCISLSSTQRFG
jgi:hypothetical protein